MKLYAELIALCDHAIVSNDNKVSIIGIFDEFRVQKLPNGFVEKFLVATIHGDPDRTYKLTVKLEKEGNSKNLLNPTNMDAKTSPNGKHNLIVRLAGVGFEKEGKYYFKIYHEDEVIGSTGLEVILLESSQQNIYRIPN